MTYISPGAPRRLRSSGRHTGGPTRTSILQERRVALALHERGIERSLLLHDAACYGMLMSMHHNYCCLCDGEQALASLPRDKVIRVLMVLGQLPPPDGIRIETPQDLTDADGRAAVLSFEMGFDPLLTGSEFWTMMARTTLALNERYGESIVGSRLWRDMAPRLYHRPTFEGLRLWLEKLGVVPAPETRRLPSMEALGPL